MRTSLTGVLRGIHTIKRQVFYRSSLIIYRGGVQSAPRPKAPLGFSFTLLLPEVLKDPARPEELSLLDSPPPYALEKWRRGEICCALLAGEEIVGAQWAAPTPTFVPELGALALGSERCWYLHDLKLSPKTRGRGLAAPLILWTITEIAARGGQEIITLVEEKNYLSHRVMRRVGFYYAGRATLLKVGPFSYRRYYGYDEEARRLVSL